MRSTLVVGGVLRQECQPCPLFQVGNGLGCTSLVVGIDAYDCGCLLGGGDNHEFINGGRHGNVLHHLWIALEYWSGDDVYLVAGNDVLTEAILNVFPSVLIELRSLGHHVRQAKALVLGTGSREVCTWTHVATVIAGLRVVGESCSMAFREPLLFMEAVLPRDALGLFKLPGGEVLCRPAKNGRKRPLSAVESDLSGAGQSDRYNAAESDRS